MPQRILPLLFFTALGALALLPLTIADTPLRTERRTIALIHYVDDGAPLVRTVTRTIRPLR